MVDVIFCQHGYKMFHDKITKFINYLHKQYPRTHFNIILKAGMNDIGGVTSENEAGFLIEVNEDAAKSNAGLCFQIVMHEFAHVLAPIHTNHDDTWGVKYSEVYRHFLKFINEYDSRDTNS